MNKKKIVQKIVLGAAIFYKGKVLILQRSGKETTLPGLWELPSGKREPREKSLDALIREVYEETGLKIKPIMPVSLFDYQIEKQGEIRDSTEIDFLAVPIGEPKVEISLDHQNYVWIGEREINNYQITENMKREIKKAFRLARTLKFGG